MNNLQEIEQSTKSLTFNASDLKVVDKVSYDSAATFILGLKDLKKEIEKFFNPTIERFKKAKAEAERGRKEEFERMNKYLNPVEDTIKEVSSKCKSYENEEKRIAELEAKRKADEIRKIAEKQKEEAEWNGESNEEKITELINVAEKIESTVDVDRVKGLGIRRTWQWKIINENEIPREFLKLDEVAINKVVREQKGKTNINGIAVYYE